MVELTVQKGLKLAVKAHQEGKIKEAEDLYRAIIKADPENLDARHNLGVLLVRLNKLEEALSLFELVVSKNSQMGQFWLSYIDCLTKLSLETEAEIALKSAKSAHLPEAVLSVLMAHFATPSWLEIEGEQLVAEQSFGQEQLTSIVDQYKSGNFKEAVQLAGRYYKSAPANAALCKVRAASLYRLKRPKLALAWYRKSIASGREDAEVFFNMGIINMGLGELQTAIENYQIAVRVKPDYQYAYVNLGNAYQARGNYDLALKNYQRALKLGAKKINNRININSVLNNNIGAVLNLKGDITGALKGFTKALALDPNYAEAHYNKGNSFFELGNAEKAIASFREAIRLNPKYTDAYTNLGNTYHSIYDLDSAIDCYERALTIKARDTALHRNLSIVKKYTADDPHISQMEDMYTDQALIDKNCYPLCFALSKAYDDCDDYSSSFKYLSEGNKIRKRLLGYDISEDINFFNDLKQSYLDIIKINLPASVVSKSIRPIFIVGMPRSGTTLVEQIVSAHSSVYGAGELTSVNRWGRDFSIGKKSANKESLKRFRDLYLSDLQKRSDGSRWVIDKMPLNFRYIPLICSALPEAKIIHVARDAAATCWSNYQHFFSADGLGYSHDLKDVVSYYALYKDLMQLWQDPCGDRICHLNYDRLTVNQEKETRSLIDYLSLVWDDSCLAPQENKRLVKTASSLQVRDKVYQGSSQKWLKYKPFLNGAFDSVEN